MRSANSSNKVLRETKQRYEVMVGEAKRRDKVTMTEGAKIRDWGGGGLLGCLRKLGFLDQEVLSTAPITR